VPGWSPFRAGPAVGHSTERTVNHRHGVEARPAPQQVQALDDDPPAPDLEVAAAGEPLQDLVDALA
jgi:hypothetical protein